MKKYNFLKQSLILSALISSVTYGSLSAYAQDIYQFDDVPQLSLPDNSTDKVQDAAPIYSADALVSLYIDAENSIYMNDNVFRSKTGKKSSLINVFSPNVRIRTDMAKHYFGADINFEVGTYTSRSENNYTDAGFRTRARFDLSDDDALHIGGSFKLDHVAIGSFVDTPSSQTVEETKYLYGDINVDWIGLLNQQNLTYDVGILSSLYNYDNVQRADTTFNINDDRDRKEHTIHGKIGYNVKPNTNVYTGLSYNIKNYDKRVDTSSTFTRNSDGYSPIIGVSYNDETKPYGFDVQGGYLSQNYDAQELKDAHILTALLTGHIQATNDLKLNGTFSRNLKESNSTGVSSYVQMRTTVHGAYKINEKWLGNAKLRYTNNDFKTNLALTALSRDDDIYDTDLWVDYKISSRYRLRGGYQYVNRKSNDSSAEYKNNIFGLSLKIKN